MKANECATALEGHNASGAGDAPKVSDKVDEEKK
jgi:hypothetical protein